MVVVLGVHRANHTDVVGHRSQVGQCLAQLDAALPVLAELEWAGQQHVGVIGLVDFDPVGVRLARPFRQLGLGIEQVHLAGTAILHKLDHSFRRAREVALAWFQIAVDAPVLIRF